MSNSQEESHFHWYHIYSLDFIKNRFITNNCYYTNSFLLLVLIQCHTSMVGRAQERMLQNLSPFFQASVRTFGLLFGGPGAW